MNFFVPNAKNNVEVEEAYQAFANHVDVSEKRIWKLSWRKGRERLQCEVGKPLPKLYGTHDELVLAIFSSTNLYKICTASRGGLRGDPVMVGKNESTQAEIFTTGE